MDYGRFDNQAPEAPASTSSWTNNLADQQQQQHVPPLQPIHQPAMLHQQPKLEQTHQPQQTVYGPPPPPPPPMTSYDMPHVGWNNPQIGHQTMISVPHSSWSVAPTAQISQPVAHVDMGGHPQAGVSDPCLHQATVTTQQSHYTTQYPAVQTAPTYWNSDLVNTQPTVASMPAPTATTIAPNGPATTSDLTLIDTRYQLNQPTGVQVEPLVEPLTSTVAISSAAIVHPMAPEAQQSAHIAPLSAVAADTTPSSSSQAQQPLNVQYEDRLAIGSSSQLEQMPANMTEGPGSLEDALEVIKSHAEHFSGPKQNCSSITSCDDDDDDEHSQGPRSGEREKDRRQANNARER